MKSTLLIQCIILGSNTAFVPNEDAVAMISSMGFTRTQAIRALKATENNVERAADWIFSHQDELDAPEVAAPAAVAQQAAAAEPQYRDGSSSKYNSLVIIVGCLINNSFPSWFNL
jgi:uncharacterized UBP type Zn finger protein